MSERIDKPKSVPPSTRDKLAVAAWALLVGVRVDLRDRFASIVSEVGLPLAQAHALVELGDEPVSMRSLANCIGNDPSNVTGLVDRLEARGLVAREPHPSDRRITHVALTSDGAALRARLHEQLYAPPTALLGMTKSELDVLVRALTKLQDDDRP